MVDKQKQIAMKSPNRQPSIKEMRVTLNVLAALDLKVPDEVLIELSNRIQEQEKVKLVRRVNRMTEEQLIKYENRPRTTLRVILADGRLVQGRTNDATFLMALKELPREWLTTCDYKVRRHPLIVTDDSGKRKRFKYYLPLDDDGIYVFMKTTAVVKSQILRYFDELYHLGWEIAVI